MKFTKEDFAGIQTGFNHEFLDESAADECAGRANAKLEEWLKTQPRVAKVCCMCGKKLDDYADARGFKRKE